MSGLLVVSGWVSRVFLGLFKGFFSSFLWFSHVFLFFIIVFEWFLSGIFEWSLF